MSVIFLVRHGQGSFGTDNYDQLSPLGREQARIVGEHFKAIGERLDALYTGSLQRQRETATLLSEGYGTHLDATVDPAFDEYEGDAILKHYAASLSEEERTAAGYPGLHKDRRRFQLFLERAARAWVDATLDAPSLLPWAGFRARVIDALSAIMAREGRGKTVVISTSGGVIGTIVAHVLRAGEHAGMELNWAVHNASFTRLIYSEDKVSLSMFNALPHLEHRVDKRLITYR